MKVRSALLVKHYTIGSLLFAMVCFSCASNDSNTASDANGDTLTAAQRHLPENGLKGLTVASNLEVHTFATEPMLKNPTNIDIDERGRVWVTEAYNYRPDINGNPTNALGDRIMILEDNNGDGRADTAKVFYQGPEIDAPLGICVLGNRVIVSQSPYIWSFYDDNGDDKADRKEILFQGLSGEQHDHGAHAFTFGPDGKLYFNCGNEGKQLKDKNGKFVLDQDGKPINQQNYRQGMIFRCDPDGSNVEFLGHNFRNPYEVAVDSYGTLWQSDNDDDGNRSTRINYVMQYGNYGYTDEMTGAGWQANRTNVEDSIPLKHWHLNDPGAVPNMLQTFAGSPTGMVVYEGKLLPNEFQNQLIHCDAGPNVVRSYTVQKSGAGYKADIINILKGEQDQWFRPADVCVAPDGSLMVADWYDPGVGGHQAGDQVRGRVYRVAPHSADNYTIAPQNYTTPQGAVAALQNPNLSVRYRAFTALQKMGSAAVPALEALWHDANADSRMRARAFWSLVKMPAADANKYLQEAVKESNPDIRITAIRAAAQSKKNLADVISALVNDSSVQVRRECALALRHVQSPQAASLWARLAAQYDGNDRWYLEALGIGADGQWKPFFAAYVDQAKDPISTAASRDIVWRARTAEALPYLAQLAANGQSPLNERLRYFRAFDFNTGPEKSKLLLGMIQNNGNNDMALNKLVLHALDIQTVRQSPVAQKALDEVLTSLNGTDEYIELVGRYEVKSQNENLLKLALQKPLEPVGRNAAGLLLRLGGSKMVWDVINTKDTGARQNSMLMALAGVGSKESVDLLQTVALSEKYPMPLREQAASRIGNSGTGEDRVLQILKEKKVPDTLVPEVVASVSGAWRGSVRTEAASYLPDQGAAKNKKPAPTMKELAALPANAADGKKVFTNLCSTCHQVGNEGNNFGPKLTEIGTKLPKEALLESIVYPSKGISFGYEGWQLKMKDGTNMAGIIASKTETDIDLKMPGGNTRAIKTSDVLAMTEMKESMMPDGLHQSISNQDMANLLAYLEAQKKK